jgi:copper ion binding protein
MTSVATYRVEGMTCDHCVRAVSEEVRGLPGVSDVAVDLATGAVTVTSGSPVSTSALASAIDEAGYVLAGPM